jgi:hypothetical protein
MDEHRKADPYRVTIISTNAPFSSFDYNENNFNSSAAVHRCFSLARSAGAQTLVIEEINEAGLVQDENLEILRYVADHKMTGLTRLSFWKPTFQREIALKTKNNDDLVGYAIVKKDCSLSKNYNTWHIFEAVFSKYPHEHNCIARIPTYEINVGGYDFQIKGILYCQQNTLNKVCAHVALRSILSRRLKSGDISYSELNKLAQSVSASNYDPSKGLNPNQIRAILTNLNIPFRDIDYSESEKHSPNIRNELPYQKYLYAGVESGNGALLGFKLSGPKANNEKHIIPFFGHTFNKDTWAPDANASYFQIGKIVGYIPSESWTSSFIGHDDNFGPNFCVPRSYVQPEQAEYVVEILDDDFKYGGVQAEALSLTFLYSLHPYLNAHGTNAWSKRLAIDSSPQIQRVVLRTLVVRKDEYIKHLSTIRDWDGNTENPEIPKLFNSLIPDKIWVVEISVPQLFPANEHKLGEVILNPYIPFDSQKPIDFNHFLFARVPDFYFFVSEVTSNKPKFINIPSKIKSHTNVLVI